MIVSVCWLTLQAFSWIIHWIMWEERPVGMVLLLWCICDVPRPHLPMRNCECIFSILGRWTLFIIYKREKEEKVKKGYNLMMSWGFDGDSL